MKRKRVKRALSILFAVTLLISLSACGKSIGTGQNIPDGGVIKETGSASVEAASKEAASKEETTKKDNASQETTTTAAANNGQTANAGENTSGGNGGGFVPEQPAQQPAETPTQPPTEAPTEPPAPTWTIYVTVDGGAYGGVFGGGTFTFYYPPTAFDALVYTGLPYIGDGNYVRSINGLAEFDHGRMSGWLYAVNGVEPGVGCGSYYLNDGDSVYWHYQGDE